MLPGSHAVACSTSRFCHAGDADLDSIHQYLPALMQPNQHNDCSAHLTNSFSRDIMESVNGSCNSLISSSSDWSTSSFMALNSMSSTLSIATDRSIANTTQHCGSTSRESSHQCRDRSIMMSGTSLFSSAAEGRLRLRSRALQAAMLRTANLRSSTSCARFYPRASQRKVRRSPTLPPNDLET